MAQDTVHVGQHTRSDKRRESIGDQVTAEQNGVPGGQLPAGVPLGEDEQGTGQESGLDEAQQEADSHHVAKVASQSGAGRDQTPESHRNGDVDGRPLDAVDEHVRRHLHQNVSHIQNTQTSRVLCVGELEVLLQSLQTGRRDVVTIQIVHDVDEHEQTAPSIQLALEALLDNGPTSRVDVRHWSPQLGHIFEVFDALLLDLNLEAVVVGS